MFYLTEDTKNLYAGADLSYNYKDVFYLAANAVYRHWTTDSDGSDVVVSFKPSVEGNLNLKVRPISHRLSASAISTSHAKAWRATRQTPSAISI